MKIEVYFDGCVWPTNPGENAGFGYVICMGTKTIKGSGKVHEDYKIDYKGDDLFTCNIAEWEGLIAAFAKLATQKEKELFRDDTIVVYGDSQLVINQAKGIWRIHAPHLKKYHDALIALEHSIPIRTISFQWIDREENYLADELSKLGAGLPPPEQDPSFRRFDADLAKPSIVALGSFVGLGGNFGTPNRL